MTVLRQPYIFLHNRGGLKLDTYDQMCGTLHVIPTVAKGGEKYLKIQWNSKRF